MHVLLTPHRPPLRSARRTRQGPPPGFARNYLLPQGLATFATPHNLVGSSRSSLASGSAVPGAGPPDRRPPPGSPPRSPSGSITIEANANPEGHLYGSAAAEQIAEALKTDNFPIEPENVKIEGPLKELGLYTIKLYLGQDVDTEVKLWVVPTHVDEVTA